MSDEHLNQQSANNEALLYQGGYDPTVADRVAASAGVTGDVQQAQQAAADFARMASEAIHNGQPLDKVRFDDPTLTEEAKAAIYAQVAQQQGTSPEEIARKAQQQAEADMKAVQGAVFGLAGVAAQPGTQEDKRSFGEIMNDLGGSFSPQTGLPGQQRSQDQGIFGR